MKKLITTIVIVLIASVAFYVFDSSKIDGTIKIGVVSPLTGNKAQVGEGLREAIKLAQKDFGTTKRQYQFIYEDSAGDSAKSASAVQKLVFIDKVNALVSITSQDGNITAKSAEEASIPHIAIANDQKISEGEYNFIHWTPIYTQSKLFVEELKKRGIKRVAIFTELNDSPVATVESFKRDIGNENIEVVWEERFTGGETDFRSMIAKNKDKPADLIMLQAFSPSIEVLRRQLVEMGVNTPVSSITNIGVAKDLKVFEGVWYVSGGQPSAEFNQKFKDQTGYDSTIGAHYGYEVAQIYLTIFEEVDDASPEYVVQNIKSLDLKNFDSITGLSGVDSQGQFISPAAVVLVQNGKNVVLD